MRIRIRGVLGSAALILSAVVAPTVGAATAGDQAPLSPLDAEVVSTQASDHLPVVADLVVRRGG